MKRKLEKEFMMAQTNLNSRNCITEKQIKKELENLEEQKHVMWMQKSRVNWIIQGDRNTKFYHTVTVRRRMRNRIPCIWNGQSLWVHKQKDIAEAFYNHFKGIFLEIDKMLEEQVIRKIFSLHIPIDRKSVV